MNVFLAMLQALLGRKKQQQDHAASREKFDSAYTRRASDQRVGKSYGAPSQRMAEASRQDDGIMSNPLHPLNPLSPISVYNTHTPSESTRNDCSSDYSGSSSSSYDSSSSWSCDSGNSSSSSSD